MNEVLGIYNVSAFYSVYVFDVSTGIDDYVKVGMALDGKLSSKISKCAIMYDKDNEPYFITHGLKVKMCEVERVGRYSDYGSTTPVFV